MSEEQSPSNDTAVEDDPPEEGAPLWMATFGDMMSLLLCFFILMFSMSEVKVDKFLLAADSLRNGLGHGASDMLASAGMGGQSIVDTDVLTSDPAPYDITIAMDDVDDFLELITKTMKGFIGQNGLGDSVEVEKTSDGVTLNIQEVVLFDTGEAIPKGGGRQVLDKLGVVVARFGMPVVVAGHTDDKPIRTRLFPSNWELSAARAAVVTRIFVEQGLDPSLAHLEGYAEFQPKADNSAQSGRAQNRRVEILYTRDNVISQMISEREQSQENQVDEALKIYEEVQVGGPADAGQDSSVAPMPLDENLIEEELALPR